MQAKMGIAIGPVGNGQSVTTWGDWQEGPAWSTIKVPLVIAAYRHQDPRQVTDLMRAAITESDNTAAESLWEQLGDPTTAGHKCNRSCSKPVIRPPSNHEAAAGIQCFRPDHLVAVQPGPVHRERFCNSENGPIFDLMGQVTPDQNWGIGKIAETSSREVGARRRPASTSSARSDAHHPAGKAAVAIAAEPSSGSFDDGTKDLNEVAKWLNDHLEALPGGQCGR